MFHEKTRPCRKQVAASAEVLHAVQNGNGREYRGEYGTSECRKQQFIPHGRAEETSAALERYAETALL